MLLGGSSFRSGRLLKRRRRARLYLTPRDHAFADGPVFLRPASMAAARKLVERKEDGDLLWRVFQAFETHAVCGERLRLGLNARLSGRPPPGAVRVGDDCAIRGIIRCEEGAEVAIGNLVYVGDGVLISAQTRVAIGDATLVAHGVQIFDGNSHPLDADERAAHFRSILGLEGGGAFTIAAAPVSIGRNCWIGFNSAILKGVSVGDEAIVAAHAVVVEDVPPRSIVAGNPARVVRTASVA
jgi:acetyltransferase-like isoleucine patch superfamily enzyme